MVQVRENLLMDFKRVKMKTIKQACLTHIKKTMRSPTLKECKTQTKTLLKWMTLQSMTSQTVMSQMKKTILIMMLMENSFKSHFSRFTPLQM